MKEKKNFYPASKSHIKSKRVTSICLVPKRTRGVRKERIRISTVNAVLLLSLFDFVAPFHPREHRT